MSKTFLLAAVVSLMSTESLAAADLPGIIRGCGANMGPDGRVVLSVDTAHDLDRVTKEICDCIYAEMRKGGETPEDDSVVLKGTIIGDAVEQEAQEGPAVVASGGCFKEISTRGGMQLAQ